MDIIRYFIRPVQQQFAIVVATKASGEIIIDQGAKPFIKGKFQMYAKNRDALESRVQQIVA